MISLGRKIICLTQGHDWHHFTDRYDNEIKAVCGRCLQVKR